MDFEDENNFMDYKLIFNFTFSPREVVELSNLDVLQTLVICKNYFTKEINDTILFQLSNNTLNINNLKIFTKSIFDFENINTFIKKQNNYIETDTLQKDIIIEKMSLKNVH